MRYSLLFPKTKKEAPKDEVSANAKLLIRAGFIDKLMAGSYTLLPLGFKVSEKIKKIIREELNKTGAQELLMPLLHPKNLWNETGRWEDAKEIMFQFKKDDKEYALSFTHEEIVMDLLRKHISSYKDLPLKVYHFSTKFRNELRPKSGILRGREFLMKDLYSAHTSKEDLMDYYWQVARAYLKIFKRMGLNAIITDAPGGVFTDEITHEFQVPCKVGEDTIYTAPNWERAKNEQILTENDKKAAGLKQIKSIEVGNIFPFGTEKYAEKMHGQFTDKNGSKKNVWFASYGIGITRLIGTLAEVFHDDKGIMWPESVTPYQVHLVHIEDPGTEPRVKEVYEKLTDAGIEVLWDDRDVSAGQKFSDADLIGIPVRLVVSKKTGEKIEFKKRSEENSELLTLEEVINKLK